VGLVFAAELAKLLDRIDTARVVEHREMVATYDLPDSLPPEADPAELLRLFSRDKKAVRGLTFVLDGPKGVEVVTDVPLDAINAALGAIS
jgi:5-deoxy-5-amino-3-dehydroquinate synthase